MTHMYERLWLVLLFVLGVAHTHWVTDNPPIRWWSDPCPNTIVSYNISLPPGFDNVTLSLPSLEEQQTALLDDVEHISLRFRQKYRNLGIIDPTEAVQYCDYLNRSLVESNITLPVAPTRTNQSNAAVTTIGLRTFGWFFEQLHSQEMGYNHRHRLRCHVCRFHGVLERAIRTALCVSLPATATPSNNSTEYDFTVRPLIQSDNALHRYYLDYLMLGKLSMYLQDIRGEHQGKDDCAPDLSE